MILSAYIALGVTIGTAWGLWYRKRPTVTKAIAFCLGYIVYAAVAIIFVV